MRIKKETQEALKTYVPLMASSALLEASRWCAAPYWEGVLHGLAFGLLLIAACRITAFFCTAFKAKPPYSQRKRQQYGNNQTL